MNDQLSESDNKVGRSMTLKVETNVLDISLALPKLGTEKQVIMIDTNPTKWQSSPRHLNAWQR